MRPENAEGRPRQDGPHETTDVSIADHADILALSDERDRHERRLLAAELRAYLDGHRDGRAAAHREAADQWRQTPGLHVIGEPALAELEARRWGPGGRERAGDPRPGDRIRIPREVA